MENYLKSKVHKKERNGNWMTSDIKAFHVVEKK